MAISDTQQLKQLNTTKTKLEAKVERLKEESKIAQQEYINEKTRLEAIVKQIKELQTENIIVTEHAILRYLERKFSLDLDQIKADILSEQNKALAAKLGSGRYPIGEGLKAVIKNRSVVTVI